MDISLARLAPIMSRMAPCDDSGLCEDIDAIATFPNERIIRHKPQLAAVIDISPVVLGHSMICPTEHVVATKYLGRDLARCIWQEAEDLGRQISKQLGAQSFVLLEHGVSPGLFGVGCVRHAHVHVCPVYNSVSASFRRGAFQEVCSESVYFSSFLEAAEYVEDIESHLLGHLGGEDWLAGVPDKDIRQVSRKLLAKINNVDSTIIDWAVAANGKLFKESLRQMAPLRTPNPPIVDES